MHVKIQCLPALLEQVGIPPDITRFEVIPFLVTYCQNPTCKKLLEEAEVDYLEEVHTQARLCSSCLYQCEYGDLEDDDEDHCQWFGLRSEFDDDMLCPNHSDKIGTLYCRECFAIVFDGEEIDEWYEAQAEHALRDMRCLKCWQASQPKIEYQTRARTHAQMRV